MGFHVGGSGEAATLGECRAAAGAWSIADWGRVSDTQRTGRALPHSALASHLRDVRFVTEDSTTGTSA